MGVIIEAVRSRAICPPEEAKQRTRGAEDYRGRENDGIPARAHKLPGHSSGEGDVSYLRVTDGTRQLRKGIEVNSRALANARPTSPSPPPSRRRDFVSRPRIIAILSSLYLRDDLREEGAGPARDLRIDSCAQMIGAESAFDILSEQRTAAVPYIRDGRYNEEFHAMLFIG